MAAALRRVRVVAALIGLFSATIVVAGPPAAADPSMSLEPKSGPPGSSIELTGTGFTPGFPPCEIQFAGTKVSDCEVDADGRVTETITVPVTAKAGTYAIAICNYCEGGEFEENVEATFVVELPLTTTTTTEPPPTTEPPTTEPPTTEPPTTEPPTTEPPTTEPPTTEPPDLDLPLDPRDGDGVPDMSSVIGEPWAPIEVDGDTAVVPDFWAMRCGPPPGAELQDFDGQAEGDLGYLVPPDAEEWQEIEISNAARMIVAPEVGTFTAPHAMRLPTEPTTSSGSAPGSTFRSSHGQFTYFGLLVGLETSRKAPVMVELVGRNVATDGVTDIDRIELGPHAAPATSCLIVVAPEGDSFNQVHLRAYTDSGGPVPLLIDHVFWSHDDVYPRSVEVERAEVSILLPSDGSRVLTEGRTKVVGWVRWPRSATLDRVEIALPTWSGTGVVVREAVLEPPTVLGGERRRVFWLPGVVVSPGPVVITASAYGPNLRGSDSVTVEGTGRFAPPEDEYRRFADEQVDVIPWAMEVTQAVRGPLEVQEPASLVDDNFPMVANKKTVVRGYAAQRLPERLRGDVREAPLDVVARLHGIRDGVTLPSSPLLPETVPVSVLSLAPGSELEAELRPDLAKTFNFVLPESWTEGGPIELRFEVNPPDHLFSVDEVAGAGGAANMIGRRVAFHDVGTVGVNIIDYQIYWRCTNTLIAAARSSSPCFGSPVGTVVSSQATPSQILKTLVDWWRRAPVPGSVPSFWTYSAVRIPHRDDDKSVSEIPEPHLSGAGVTSSDVLNEFIRRGLHEAFWRLVDCSGVWRDRIRADSLREFIWLVEPPFVPGGGGGCAAYGRTWAFRAVTRGDTAAHEAGHVTGMRHDPGHGEADPIIRWDGDHGEMAPPSIPTYGFDTQAMTVINPVCQGRTCTPSGGARGSLVHDYMSYGTSRWTSVGTWFHALGTLAANDPASDTRGRQTVRCLFDVDYTDSRSEDCDYQGLFGREPADAGDSGGEVMVVEGMVGEDGEVLVRVPWVAPAGQVTVEPGDEVKVELIDTNGAIPVAAAAGLARTWADGESEAQSFAVELPVGVDAATLRVTVAGIDPVEVNTSGPPPSITITETPRAQQPMLRWEASGVEGPYLVEVSDDDGHSWRLVTVTDMESLQLGLPSINRASSEPRSDANTAVAPPFQGAGWRLRVQASDGVRVAAAKVDDVDLGVAPPAVLLGVPTDGAWVEPGMVRVEAVPSAIGDGATYQWAVDGDVVAEGRTGMVPVVTEGTHTITLIAENAADRSEASIEVTASFDTDTDGLVDAWERRYGFDPDRYDDPDRDHDGDGLATGDEYRLGTDPTAVDTDGDGVGDGEELNGFGDPLDPNPPVASDVDDFPITRPVVDDVASVATLPGPGDSNGAGSQWLPWLLGAVAGFAAAGLAGFSVARLRTARQRRSSR